MIAIIDASVVVDALIGAGHLVDRLVTYELHAPVSIDAEVLHGVRRKWWRELITDDEADAVVKIFQTLPISRHAVAHLVDRMWSFRHNITAYDAGYVALAESMNVPLLTRDGRLSRSSGHAASIEYFE
jgi:predicted nucleic acid-binding protein